MDTPSRVRLWDEINRYVVACGGDPSKHVYGNTPRQVAVAQVEKIVREVETAWANDMRKITDECESLRASLARAETLVDCKTHDTEGVGPCGTCRACRGHERDSLRTRLARAYDDVRTQRERAERAEEERDALLAARSAPVSGESERCDPFNCPKCGRHDGGLIRAGLARPCGPECFYSAGKGDDDGHR